MKAKVRAAEWKKSYLKAHEWAKRLEAENAELKAANERLHHFGKDADAANTKLQAQLDAVREWAEPFACFCEEDPAQCWKHLLLALLTPEGTDEEEAS